MKRAQALVAADRSITTATWISKVAMLAPSGGIEAASIPY
jgi:hypothetical protein